MAAIADFSFKGAKARILEPGDILYKEGSIADKMFYIESDTITLTRKIQDKVVRIGEAYEGEFLSERAILGDDVPRVATAEADTDCEVLVIGKKECKKCFDELPPFIQKMITRMARRLTQANELVVKLVKTQEMVKEMAVKMQELEGTMLESMEHHGIRHTKA